jgi:hypothetical protein
LWKQQTGTSRSPVISYIKCPGQNFGGYDYETGVRIAESYEVSGKRLGIFIDKGKD